MMEVNILIHLATSISYKHLPNTFTSISRKNLLYILLPFVRHLKNSA